MDGVHSTQRSDSLFNRVQELKTDRETPPIRYLVVPLRVMIRYRNMQSANVVCDVSVSEARSRSVICPIRAGQYECHGTCVGRLQHEEWVAYC